MPDPIHTPITECPQCEGAVTFVETVDEQDKYTCDSAECPINYILVLKDPE
jgi:hypothetical protein